jgi:hypothetical protein|tara:strand:+ start:72 stop:227 length:156 start_codon:yes stop_codon:yes gene_type:complete
MYIAEAKEKLADLLVEFESQLRTFEDGFESVDGLLVHLENAILEINEEINK